MRLQDYRKAHHLTLQDIASKVGVTRQAVHLIERRGTCRARIALRIKQITNGLVGPPDLMVGVRRRKVQPARDNLRLIAAYIPKNWMHQIDEVVRHERTRNGLNLSRSDIVRMALAEFMGPCAEGGEKKILHEEN